MLNLVLVIIVLSLIAYWLIRPETYRMENERTRGIKQIVPDGLPAGRTIFVDRQAGALDYLEMHYRSSGDPDKPPVILIHGLSGDSGTTWYNTYAFVAQSYFVIGVDLRGHGLSMQPPGDYSIAMMAEDVAALMDVINIQRAYVVGHSMGGLVAMQLAHTFPDRVQALVLVDTTATWNQGWFEHFMWLYPYWVRIKNRIVGWEQENRNRARSFTRYEVEPQYHEWIYQRRDLNQIEPYIASWRAIINFSAEKFLPNIQQPTVIICGEDDDLVPPAFREQLNRLIPQSMLHIIPSPARHYPQIQFAAHVNEILLMFLDQNGQITASG